MERSKAVVMTEEGKSEEFKFNKGVRPPGLLTLSATLFILVLSSVSNVNLTSHRTQLSKAITKRDLGSFADQLNTVARQLSDPIVCRKIDNIAYMVRKAVQTEMQKLVDIRNRMIFKITALEVLLVPLNKQANQSLSHLKTIQFFLDNQGWQIADKTGKQFTARIESYLEDLYNHVNEKLTKQIGKCRPLWDIFYLSRHYLCQQIIDPLVETTADKEQWATVVKKKGKHLDKTQRPEPVRGNAKETKELAVAKTNNKTWIFISGFATEENITSYLENHKIVETNGISFSCFFLILLFIIVTPVVIKLVEFYREDNNANVLTSISHRRNVDEVTWASPASQSPEGPLSGRGRDQQTSWVSPRRPSLPLIPTPSRQTNFTAFTAHSIQQIFFVLNKDRQF
ncbi:unnamed protein product [Brassicogethes aeneus]|uniref:Uncharacterized protein n=1 Tax=Brassicogethes aeneus TaxID=1431903 RepID=A0A9P0B1Y6_BRAAE|nr:unnamed protein product [Brassicogethes aeneus]